MKLPNIRVLISFVVLIFDLYLLSGLFFFNIPPENRDMVNIFLGASISWSGDIISRYFEERNKG